MNELFEMGVEQLNEMPNEEFEEKLGGNLFAEFEALLPLLPREAVELIKKTKFSEIKALIEKNAPEKAKIIGKKKKWGALEKGFGKLKKKL